ncbi:MAG TPA: hypothetical protein VMU34_16475 [Mycobacterium sp.]|nr:hypothetical protein [Mycobacterium sp.]
MLNIGLNVAFNTLGSGNTLRAGSGPFAVAGTILQSNQTVQRVTTGFHIKGPLG